MAALKPRLLLICDHCVPTGFARVSENIAVRLREEWDLVVVALNYFGDPHSFKYPVYPARNQGDIWGIGQCRKLLHTLHPDALLVINDPWIIRRFVEEINRGSVPMAAYMPVDARNIPRETSQALNGLDLAIFYTDFGRTEIEMGGYQGPSKVIPHGVDVAIYRPLSRDAARTEMRLSGLPKDTFIVGNVNRNQPRKRLDLTVEVFAEWVHQYRLPDNVYLYIHCAQQDAGWNLAQLASYYGVAKRLILPHPEVVSPTEGLTEEEMAWVYNAFDVQISTTTGEGWGLCVSPETMIQAPEGAKMMRDINPGDPVMVEDGSFRPVLAKIARTADTIKIKAAGLPAITASAEHPFLLLPRRADPAGYYCRHPEAPLWRTAGELREGDLIACPRPKWNATLQKTFDMATLGGSRLKFDTDSVWLKSGYSPRHDGSSLSAISERFGVSKRVAEDARAVACGVGRSGRGGVGSAAHAIAEAIGPLPFVQPVKAHRVVPMDARTLEFLGWYLAEGSTDGGARVEIDLHRREGYIAERLKRHVSELFGIGSAIDYNGPNKCRLRISSAIIARFVTRFCGRHARRKLLHPDLWNSAMSLGPLIAAYFLGDGHYARGYWAVTTASAGLAWQMRAVLATAGIHASINPIVTQRAWLLRVGGEAANRLSEFCGLPRRLERIRAAGTTALVRDDYIFVPVRRVTKNEEPEAVMDIQVDGVHSFIGNGAVLHNSQIEGAACAIPQIVPQYSGLGEWMAGAALFVPCNDHVTHIGINTIGGVPEKRECVKALHRLYTSPELRAEYAEKALVRAREPRFRWPAIADLFQCYLGQMLIDSRARAQEAKEREAVASAPAEEELHAATA